MCRVSLLGLKKEKVYPSILSTNSIQIYKNNAKKKRLTENRLK